MKHTTPAPSTPTDSSPSLAIIAAKKQPNAATIGAKETIALASVSPPPVKSLIRDGKIQNTFARITQHTMPVIVGRSWPVFASGRQITPNKGALPNNVIEIAIVQKSLPLLALAALPRHPGRLPLRNGKQ